MFSQQEYAQRLGAARAAVREQGLAALLVFAQESHYYLFGYDGGGYVFFQCALLTADERPVTLLCRRPGMVFFPHVMLGDVKRRLAIGLGNTVLVTGDGAQSLTRHSLEMIRA